MNLLKTTQLNINDMLDYLNYKQISNEQKHFHDQQQVCKGYQLNVRLKQNWITGPSKQFQHNRSRSLALHSNLSVNSIHNVKAADGKSTATGKVSDYIKKSKLREQEKESQQMLEGKSIENEQPVIKVNDNHNKTTPKLQLTKLQDQDLHRGSTF